MDYFYTNISETVQSTYMYCLSLENNFYRASIPMFFDSFFLIFSLNID